MISASLVKELREQTGAGMMDCKKALAECDGNLEAAVDWLREKGIAKAGKKEARIAAEGLADIFINGNKAVMIEVNAETDFVSKNEEFTEMIKNIGETILKDRQMLSESGAVLIACTIDSRNKEIVSYPKVGSKGFLPSTVVGEIARKLEDKALQIVEKYLEKENIIIEELEKKIKETISKEIIDETNKTPVVIATVIDKSEE